MPETYLLYRFFFEKEGITEDWRKAFYNLSDSEIQTAKKIIEENDFKNISEFENERKLYQLLKHYTIAREDITNSNSEISKLKAIFDNLAKEDKYGFVESLECL